MSGLARTVRLTDAKADPVQLGTEPDLLAVRAQSDPAAFVPLFQYFFDQVYWYCYGRLHDHAAAEDATSLVFEKVLINLPRFDPSLGSFRSWLFRIAHNVVVDMHRSNNRHPSTSLDAALWLSDTAPTPEEEYLLLERRRQVLDLLPSLPESERTVIELRLAGLDTMEIYAVLERSRAAVDTAHSRAVAKLRQALAIAAPGAEAEHA